MSGQKQRCPGCDSIFSVVGLGFIGWDDERCPRCGLGQAIAAEVLEIRRRFADEQLKARCEELTLAVGRLESENADLQRRLDAIREAVPGLDPSGPVPAPTRR